MYRIRPYFNDFEVQPAKIMYSLPNYHKESLAATDMEKIDEVEGIEQPKTVNEKKETAKVTTAVNQQDQDKDKQFIERLKSLSSRLDAFIISSRSSKSSGNDVLANCKVTQKPTEEEKILPNSPDVLHALVGPTSCAVFPIHDYGDAFRKHHAAQKIECYFRLDDNALINLLKKLCAKRGIDLVDEGENASVGKIVIKLHPKSEDFRIVFDGQTIVGDCEVWKFLGAMFGVYLSADQTLSTLTDKWLGIAAECADLDVISRKMGAHLGKFDFLSSQHAICLTDLVLRSRFSNKETGELIHWSDVKAANNVQLWIKRIDDALSLD